MIVLGIILVLIAAAIGLLGVWAASQATSAALTTTILNSTFDVSPLMLFLSGMAAVVLLWIGLRLLGFGTRRTVGKRRERKELMRTQREQEQSLAETKRRLGTTEDALNEDRARLDTQRDQERAREAKLRIEADRRREAGREEQIRRLAAERDQAVRPKGNSPD